MKFTSIFFTASESIFEIYLNDVVIFQVVGLHEAQRGAAAHSEYSDLNLLSHNSSLLILITLQIFFNHIHCNT